MEAWKQPATHLVVAGSKAQERNKVKEAVGPLPVRDTGHSAEMRRQAMDSDIDYVIGRAKKSRVMLIGVGRRVRGKVEGGGGAEATNRFGVDWYWRGGSGGGGGGGGSIRCFGILCCLFGGRQRGC